MAQWFVRHRWISADSSAGDPSRLALHSRELWQKAWRTYGFVDAFNPLTNWYSADVLGIDFGISILMAENARTGFVWEQFMKNEEVNRGMTRAGFRTIPTATTAS